MWTTEHLLVSLRRYLLPTGARRSPLSAAVVVTVYSTFKGTTSSYYTVASTMVTMTNKSLLFILFALGPLLCSAFMGGGISRSFVSTTSLSVGPLQKLTNKKEYNKVVENLMQTNGLTREQAEKEYNSYLENPNDYALQKVRDRKLNSKLFVHCSHTLDFL